jgi:FkbM family methyltransferase
MQSLLDRRLPLRTRRSLLAADVRRKIARAELYEVHYGPAAVYLSDADYVVDRKSFDFAVVEANYATEYDGAVVVDLGAHKGYYGAYAVTHGARAVVAYEPESTNLAVLERTANGYRGRAEWTIRHAAVTATSGRADLHVMSGSWGHALAPPESFARYEVGLETVDAVALADVLAEAAAMYNDSCLVVKVNIEGGECPAILSTPAGAWNAVDEVFVETHSWADCEATDLARHLEPSGLTRIESAHRAVLRMRREGSSRSGRRSAPT